MDKENLILQANELTDKANKTIKKGILTKFFGPSNEKLNDVAEMLFKAGNLYKIGKKYDEAGKVYFNAGENFSKTCDTGEAINSYTEALKSYVKAKNIEKAEEMFGLIQDISTNYYQVGKMHKEIAMFYEQEEEYKRAIFHYESGMQLLEASNANTEVMNIYKSIALCYVKINNPNYSLASENFEKCAELSLVGGLLKYQAKSNLFDSLICILATKDVVLAEKTLEKYINLDYTFGGSNEGRLFQDILACYKDLNELEFVNILESYDKIYKLDNYRVTMLLEIRQRFGGDIEKNNNNNNEIDIT
jgi:alpha-soluble NSF attachment protein